jgi:hypothetical protein
MKFYSFLFFTIFIHSSYIEMSAQTVPINAGLPACFLGLVQRTNFSIYGDSRVTSFSSSFELTPLDDNPNVVPGVYGYLEIATTESGRCILSDGSTSPTGNHGFLGSSAKNWEGLIDNCNKVSPGGFIPDTTTAVIHLGGNDILSDYDDIAEIERYWMILTFLANPVDALKNLLEGFFSGNIRKTNELLWTWRLSASAMTASTRVKNISKHFAGRGTKVLVSLPAVGWQQRRKNLELKTMTRMLFAFSLLRSSLSARISSLSAYHLGFIRLDDMFRLSFDYENYSKQLVFDKGLFFDFTHFSVGGNIKWGKRLATKLAVLRWLPAHQEFIPDSISEIEAIFDLEASDAGLSDNDIANGIFGTIISEELYEKIYRDFIVFLRNPSVIAVSIRGAINTKFNEINGLNILGIPVSNETCFQLACLQKIQLFECGFMTSDIFGTNYFGTDKCDRIAPDLQDEHPEFTTCTSDAACSYRWFEYRVEKLVAERGRPPFFFNLVDENCLPDNITLDSLGRIVMNPVGGPGELSCEVEMTDADDRTIRKTVKLSSGL